jgi:hypothetical protein
VTSQSNQSHAQSFVQLDLIKSFATAQNPSIAIGSANENLVTSAQLGRTFHSVHVLRVPRTIDDRIASHCAFSIHAARCALGI